jgi:predicted Fe-Mo cluster-binding NifX family protein
MKVVVTSSGADLNAPASPVFGRCPTYIFVDTETMQFEAVPNPSISAGGGAGIQAAQFVVEQGAQAALTGNVGPNAFNVFQAAGVPIYLLSGGTVREAVEMYKNGQLQPVGGANVQAGMGMGRGMGMGGGRGMGRGMGLGGGRGMGRGGWSGIPQTPPTPPSAPPPSAPARERENEVADLRQAAADLRRQLAEVMERIDKLGKES